MASDPDLNDYVWHLADEVRAGRITRRDLIRRASVMGIAASGVSAALAACGSSSSSSASSSSGTSSSAAAGTPKRGGTMTVAVTPPTAALDPLTLQDDGSFVTLQQCYEYLSWVEEDGSITPVLAESWSPTDGGKTWIFKIRQGVKFSDGRPLTSADVAATFNRLADPKNSSNALAYFQGLLGKGQTEAMDTYTVAFHLERPFGDFPYYVASANYNSFILPANYNADYSHPVGTGPFVITNYTPKVGATFTRNPHYWRPGLPYLDGVHIQYYAENQAMVLAMQAGSIDIMNTTPYQGSQALFADSNIRILTARSSTWREVSMRVDQAPWTDQRVRQALAYTLDRQQILQTLFHGQGDLGEDHLFAPSFGVPVNVPARTQDIAKAKSLLAAAGHPNGVKATMTTENFLEIPQFVTLMQQMAAKAGIDITLNIESQTTYYGSGANQPWLVVNFGCVDWSARAVPSQLNDTCATCKGIWNSSKWCNPAFDQLTRQYDSTLDMSTRNALATKMAAMLQEGTPMIIAYWVSVPRSMQMNVHGVQPSGYDFLDLTRAWLA